MCGGSTALFVYGYCFYYYYARSGMSGFMQTSFFFGYNLMVRGGGGGMRGEAREGLGRERGRERGGGREGREGQGGRAAEALGQLCLLLRGPGAGLVEEEEGRGVEDVWHLLWVQPEVMSGVAALVLQRAGPRTQHTGPALAYLPQALDRC